MVQRRNILAGLVSLLAGCTFVGNSKPVIEDEGMIDPPVDCIEFNPDHGKPDYVTAAYSAEADRRAHANVAFMQSAVASLEEVLNFADVNVTEYDTVTLKLLRGKVVNSEWTKINDGNVARS